MWTYRGNLNNVCIVFTKQKKIKNYDCYDKTHTREFVVPPERVEKFKKACKENIEKQKAMPKYDFSKLKGWNTL